MIGPHSLLGCNARLYRFTHDETTSENILKANASMTQQALGKLEAQRKRMGTGYCSKWQRPGILAGQ